MARTTAKKITTPKKTVTAKKTATPKKTASAKKTVTAKKTATAKGPTTTAARPSPLAKKSTTVDLKAAVARTADLSEEVLKSVEASQLAAIKAVRKFVDTVDEALPKIGQRPSTRETVIDAALQMADRLVATQYDFLRNVVRTADRSLNKPATTKK
jgi:hypothetical protein